MIAIDWMKLNQVSTKAELSGPINQLTIARTVDNWENYGIKNYHHHNKTAVFLTCSQRKEIFAAWSPPPRVDGINVRGILTVD